MDTHAGRHPFACPDSDTDPNTYSDGSYHSNAYTHADHYAHRYAVGGCPYCYPDSPRRLYSDASHARQHGVDSEPAARDGPVVRELLVPANGTAGLHVDASRRLPSNVDVRDGEQGAVK